MGPGPSGARCRQRWWPRSPRSRRGAGKGVLPLAVSAVTAIPGRNDTGGSSADVSPRRAGCAAINPRNTIFPGPLPPCEDGGPSGLGGRDNSGTRISAWLLRLRRGLGTDKTSLLQVGGGDAGQSAGIAGMSSTLFIIPRTCRNSAGLCNGFQEIFLLSAFGALIPRAWFLPEVGCGGENELKSNPAQVGFCLQIPSA